jgi:hypothetical protein
LSATHTGLVARIRTALDRDKATIARLSEQLGESREHVRKAVYEMCARLGGIAEVPGSPRRAREFASIEWIKRQESHCTRARSGVVAGRVEIRGYRYGWGWRL